MEERTKVSQLKSAVERHAHASELSQIFTDLLDQEKLHGKLRAELAAIESNNLLCSRSSLELTLKKWFMDLEPSFGWTRSISSPILRLGKYPKSASDFDTRLITVDRVGVEGVRAVQRLIEQYLKRAGVLQLVNEEDATSGRDNSRPLSIAVFGPPGSGKSVAVKSILKQLENHDIKLPITEINLSQLDSFEELWERLKSLAANRKKEDSIPIIFFDEFDSSLKSERLGWLKYFLPIMEDGEPFEQAIYVFAGGTAETFEEFSLAGRSITDPEWSTFAQKKGPDYVSRLNGHINVVGINPAGPDDDLYIIRRALALRFMISNAQKNLTDGKHAKIDRNMINAFLYVPNYVHGSRSMRMLVELCTEPVSKRICMSQVPPVHQLDMQVDGKVFAALASGQSRPNSYRHSVKQ